MLNQVYKISDKIVVLSPKKGYLCYIYMGPKHNLEVIYLSNAGLSEIVTNTHSLASDTDTGDTHTDTFRNCIGNTNIDTKIVLAILALATLKLCHLTSLALLSS